MYWKSLSTASTQEEWTGFTCYRYSVCWWHSGFDKLDFSALLLLLSLSCFPPWLFPSAFHSHQLSVLASLSPQTVLAGSCPSANFPQRRIDFIDGPVLLFKNTPHPTPPVPHPPILFVLKWARLRGRATARINAQISTISLRLHVCQTACCKGITRCLLDAARRWQLPHHLVFSFTVRNQMAAS